MHTVHTVHNQVFLTLNEKLGFEWEMIVTIKVMRNITKSFSAHYFDAPSVNRKN